MPETQGSIEQLFSLKGQTALVTGSSSGLGVVMARVLARAGANVALLARRKDRLEKLAEELRQLGVRSLALQADVTDEKAVDAAVEQAENELGPISVLINAAGVSPLGRAERHSREKWDNAFAVNVTGVFLASQAVGKRMIARGGPGRIIQISSVMAQGANPVHRVVGYAASKGAVNNLTRQLAVEWAQYGITVNAIAPGYFPTEMTIDPSQGEVDAEQAAQIQRLTPMHRLGKLEEIETAVLFLAAPASSYVTGVVLPVDGGWTAW
jgi:NAD(P)-dependent dehydrogenase (short-subunit alcohol dehydrogenase family)